MLKLLKKEIVLAMHPITPVMLLLSAMVLIPNYPYAVIFFYITMALFFTCLLGRENNDIVYSLNLPVAKRNIVRARLMLATLTELLQMALMLPLAMLSARLTPLGNQAGMDPNIALFAEGFIVYGLFNFVFFRSYYRNVARVGVAFIKSSVIIFLCSGLDIVLCYTLPLFRDILDTPDPLHLPYKLAFLAIGIAVYAALTLLARRGSERDFEAQDLH